ARAGVGPVPPGREAEDRGPLALVIRSFAGEGSELPGGLVRDQCAHPLERARGLGRRRPWQAAIELGMAGREPESPVVVGGDRPVAKFAGHHPGQFAPQLGQVQGRALQRRLAGGRAGLLDLQDRHCRSPRRDCDEGIVGSALPGTGETAAGRRSRADRRRRAVVLSSPRSPERPAHASPERPMRQSLYTYEQLKRLLEPRSVAVIGASRTPGAFGNRVMQHLASYGGKVWAVNPKYDSVEGRPCVPSIEAIDESPDCVVITVPRDHVEANALACARKGVGGLVIFASGYAEVGTAERIAQQQRLTAMAEEHGMPIIGPNCIGIVNTSVGAVLTFSGAPNFGKPGERAIGLISQSGALAFAMAQAVEHGVQFSHVMTSGNACDVDVADQVAYLARDPACHAIACLFEGMAAPTRLLEAAALAQQAGKPLVIFKIASSEQGATAAASHTGSLAGSDAVYRASLERLGVVLVDDFEALVETTSFFAKAPPPKASGVAVIASSGGGAIMCADKAEKHGVPLPQPSEATREVLLRHIPEFGSARNPCDVTAQVLTVPESFVACTDALMRDPGYGALVFPAVYAYTVMNPRIEA